MKNIFSKLLTLTPDTVSSNSVGYRINNDYYISIHWDNWEFSNPEKEFPCFEVNRSYEHRDKNTINFSIIYDGIFYPIELTNEEKVTVEYVLMTKVKECIANTKKKLNDEITKKILESRQSTIANGGITSETKEQS